MLAVQVLMQAVVVAGAVAKQQGRRPSLPGSVTAPEELRVRGRKPRLFAQELLPAVGHGRELRVQHFAQLADQRRQWIGEVLVLAAAEAMARHDDPAAEV